MASLQSDGMTVTVILGVVMFTLVVLALVIADPGREKPACRVGSGENPDQRPEDVEVPAGGKLSAHSPTPACLSRSACGGGGTCAQCKVKILEAEVRFSRPRRATSRRKKPPRANDSVARWRFEQ